MVSLHNPNTLAHFRIYTLLRLSLWSIFPKNFGVIRHPKNMQEKFRKLSRKRVAKSHSYTDNIPPKICCVVFVQTTLDDCCNVSVIHVPSLFQFLKYNCERSSKMVAVIMNCKKLSNEIFIIFQFPSRFHGTLRLPLSVEALKIIIVEASLKNSLAITRRHERCFLQYSVLMKLWFSKEKNESHRNWW